jgi:hypothetical protein
VHFFEHLFLQCLGELVQLDLRPLFRLIRLETSYSEMLQTIHGTGERISTENLVFGTSVLYNIVERFATRYGALELALWLRLRAGRRRVVELIMVARATTVVMTDRNG